MRKSDHMVVPPSNSIHEERRLDGMKEPARSSLVSRVTVGIAA